MKLLLSKKGAIALVILLAVLLNLSIFCFAYPQTFKPESPTLARDFSAYYNGEWRLFHNPTEIYVGGTQPGDYPFSQQPQTFKYAPSFLILLAPFLTLSYQNALNAFDIIQFLSILFLAFFVYKLVENKNLFLAAIVAVIVLVDPLLFSPSASYSAANFLHYRIISLHVQTFSPSYYCGYLLANAHILQTVLLVGALYFGFAKKPWLSALLFAFGAFDPRGALLALPLLLWYNRHSIWAFIAGSAAFLAATNLPFFFYYGIGFAFLKTETNGSVVSQMYLYDWIPLFSIASLTILEIITVLYNRKIHFSFPLNLKTEKLENQKKQ
ncbi:MAG: hypothetical protein ABSC20_10400 [Candidatus Bathyarchaeia archaeon]|jgi:hypothetical protein